MCACVRMRRSIYIQCALDSLKAMKTEFLLRINRNIRNKSENFPNHRNFLLTRFKFSEFEFLRDYCKKNFIRKIVCVCVCMHEAILCGQLVCAQILQKGFVSSKSDILLTEHDQGWRQQVRNVQANFSKYQEILIRYTV